MFLYAGCYGEDVGVKDDAVGIEVDPMDQQVVRPLADGNLVLARSGLQQNKSVLWA